MPPVMPRTQAMDSQSRSRTGSTERINLTLGRTVCKAPSGNWVGDGRGNVDDAAPLLGGTGRKGSFVGVLAINRIRDDGVDREGTVRIHVKHLGEVLTHCQTGSLQGTTPREFITFAESTSLWDHVRDGAMAAQ